MKHLSKSYAVVYLYLLILVTSCKKDDCSDCITEDMKPRANAGTDQSILVQMDGILDGRSSYDRIGDIKTYKWSVISGPSGAIIDNANASQTFARFSATGIYQFELQVTNEKGITATDNLQVRVDTIPGESICNRPVVSAKLLPIGKLPGPKANMKTIAVGNKIIFAGATKPAYSGTVDIYDISTNSWTGVPLSDEAYRSELAITSLGNKVFFAGGGHYWSEFYTSVVDIYDASTNSWSKANLSQARQGIAAAAVGNKVVFAGGGYFDEMLPTGFTTVDVVDIYDNATNTWATAKLSESRMHMNGSSSGDEFYFSGGTTSSNGASDRIDIYNASANSWSVSTLKIPRTRMEGIVDQKNLFLSGGYRLDGSNSINQVEIIDLTTGISTLDCMIPKNGQTPVKSGDYLIFFTGYAGPGHLLSGSVFEIYNPKTKKWSVGVLNRAIHNAGIVSVNNIIYVGGGIDAAGKVSDILWKLEF